MYNYSKLHSYHSRAMQSTTNSLRNPAEELLGKSGLVKRFRISFTTVGSLLARNCPLSVQHGLGTSLWYRSLLSHTSSHQAAL